MQYSECLRHFGKQPLHGCRPQCAKQTGEYSHTERRRHQRKLRLQHLQKAADWMRNFVQTASDILDGLDHCRGTSASVETETKQGTGYGTTMSSNHVTSAGNWLEGRRKMGEGCVLQVPVAPPPTRPSLQAHSVDTVSSSSAYSFPASMPDLIASELSGAAHWKAGPLPQAPWRTNACVPPKPSGVQEIAAQSEASQLEGQLIVDRQVPHCTRIKQAAATQPRFLRYHGCPRPTARKSIPLAAAAADIAPPSPVVPELTDDERTLQGLLQSLVCPDFPHSAHLTPLLINYHDFVSFAHEMLCHEHRPKVESVDAPVMQLTVRGTPGTVAMSSNQFVSGPAVSKALVEAPAEIPPFHTFAHGGASEQAMNAQAGRATRQWTMAEIRGFNTQMRYDTSYVVKGLATVDLRADADLLPRTLAASGLLAIEDVKLCERKEEDRSLDLALQLVDSVANTSPFDEESSITTRFLERLMKECARQIRVAMREDTLPLAVWRWERKTGLKRHPVRKLESWWHG